MKSAEQILLEAFHQAAQAGARCPSNIELSDLVYSGRGKRWRDALNRLVAEGKITIEIAGKNWRVVRLVAEGISTAAEPSGAPVWRILDAQGTRKP